MSLNRQNIDNELLRKYYNGGLSDVEKNALEQKALEDPFLKEAMDGFDENPGGFNEFDARHIKSNAGVGRTMLFGVAAILIIGISVVLINNSLDTPAEEIVVNDQDTLGDGYVEVEVLPLELETLEVVQETDQITAEEIVQNKLLIEEGHRKPEDSQNQHQNNSQVDHDNDTITIDPDDNLHDEDEYNTVDENHGQTMENSAPATYLHGLYVVDYRELEREKREISYKRYDLPGTSADKENDSIDYSDQLVEREVNVPYMDYLEDGMGYFKRSKFKKALNRYKTILEQYGADMNALFYGGLCYYNMKKYEEALKDFDAIIAHKLNAFKEEALWYKVKTLLKLNRKPEAKETLDEIIIKGGFYLQDAIELRKNL